MTLLSHKLRLLTRLCVLLLCVTPIYPEPQINRTIELTTGTAVRIVGLRTMANSLLIQVQPNASAVVYVLYAALGTTCTTSDTSQIVATLAPGSATAPGQSFTFPSNGSSVTQSGGFDVSRYCVQGETGDVVIASYDLRN